MLALKGAILMLIVWALVAAMFILGGCASSRGAVSVPADAVQER